MTVIDFHVHPFASRKYNLNMYPGAYDLELGGMERQLRDAGITHICGSVLSGPMDPSDFEELRTLNDEALRLRDALRGFYTPGFHIHPAFPRESIEEIGRMRREGVRLIGELVPYAHGWDNFSEESFMEILNEAERYHMVVSYHTPFEYDMSRAIESHPGILFVAAHPGDRQRAMEQAEFLKKHDNLCLDLSGTGLHRFGLVKYLTEKVGAEKLLFGTDYPICNPRMYVEALYGEEISCDAREAIFHKNAERILKLT